MEPETIARNAKSTQRGRADNPEVAGAPEPAKDSKSGLGRRFFGLIIYLAVVAVFGLALPKVLAWSLGTPYPVAAITSQSMWPVLKRGDLVFVKRAGRAEIKKGAIIVYKRGSSFIIHRVVDAAADVVTTKGDANMEADPAIAFSDVIGVVPTVRGAPAKLPWLGRIAFSVNRPPDPR